MTGSNVFFSLCRSRAFKERPTGCHRGRNYLDNPDITDGFKNRAIRGAGIVIGAQIFKFFIKFLSTLVLARLITPQDFGLIAMVATITNLISMFNDMGLARATVQQEKITQEQVSTLFWINIAVSVGLTALTIAIAPLISLFYDSASLTWITIVLASGFIVSGISVQHQALLVRQMRFKALAAVEISSMFVGSAIGILAAYRGMSYWSLVIMQLSTVFAMSLGSWIACDWRPGMPVRGAGIGSMLRYGGNLTGFSFLNYFHRNLDNVLIGRYWGSLQLGLYDRAYQLMLLPITQIIAPVTGVAIPALSRLQDDPERFRRYYLGAVNVLAFFLCPTMITMAVMSDEVVFVLLGPQWVGASTIFKTLSIVAIVQPLYATTGWIYQSLGKTDRMMRWGMISIPCYILSFIAGLPWGGNGVAIAYTICNFIMLWPGILYAFHGTPLNARDFFQAVLCPFVIGLLIFIFVSIYHNYMHFLSPKVFILGSVVSAIFVLLLSAIFWPRAHKETELLWLNLKTLRSGN